MDDKDNGILSRVFSDLFTRPKVSDMKFRISFIEIYNGKAYDLLSDTPEESIAAKGKKKFILLSKVALSNVLNQHTID